MGENSIVTETKGLFYDFISSLTKFKTMENACEWMVTTLNKQLNLTDSILYRYEEYTKNFIPYVREEKQINFDSFPYNALHNSVYICETETFLTLKSHDVLHGAVKLNGLDKASFSLEQLESIAEECSNFFYYNLNSTEVLNNGQKYEQLYRLTKKFHSTMKKNDVLVELISTLQKMFPFQMFYLFLSHDSNDLQNLPIKNLDYEDQSADNIKAMEAYVTGDVQAETSELDNETVLYIPLKGNQGIYGVLQVLTMSGIVEENNNIDFITLLAGAAGVALENAQLYEQSNRLVKDLQIINETSHELNKNLRFNDIMAYMSKRIMESIDCDEVGFIYFDKPETNKILSGSTEFFYSSLAEKYIKYFRKEMEKHSEELFIGDISTVIQDAAMRSVMAVPMIYNHTLKGYAVILSKEPYHFSLELFKLVQSLVHHSTLALSNSLLREELETLVKTDYLTKLTSRNYFNEKIVQSMNEDRQGTFILIDIDDFKKVNDTHGHQIGDEVLIQVANIIKNNIRERDIGARWGGEELAIYLPQVEPKTGIKIAKRVVQKVRELTNPTVTISCGVTYWTAGKNDTFQYLFSLADKALYEAKHNGKNQVIIKEELE
ncbi:sensor domain-containing diguanylate cyclase [Metabacillus fastidiosus]|uniref:sensor domain-containing diguanylate cyclase n=1 Tax=Metabacillus fastidiosus TaxID=1458 RepID=UPI002DB65FFE|nr:diguanylate cyclase [Metabacillus fastidiosus]MEC2077720.1 diguanylate cyclase [Metabacillus fastidiosus]